MDPWQEEEPPTRKDIDEENRMLARRQQNFRLAADYIARAFAQHPSVQRIAIIGSVALPLKKEVPRFRRYRRRGIELLHECSDVDLAVWVDDLDCLNDLRKARSRALNQLNADANIGVAHHQAEVFILEPHTHRYRGRLCTFGSCPKQGKLECEVAGCGVKPFLQQIENFRFDRFSLIPDCSIALFDREGRENANQDAESGKEPDDQGPF